MKTMLLVLAMVACSERLLAQSCTSPIPIDYKTSIGTWRGSYSFKGSSVPIVIILDKKGEKLNSTLIFSEKRKMKSNVIECNRGDLHINQKIDNLEMEFKGTPTGNNFSGKLILRENGELLMESFTLTKDSTH